jgi:hypothetical protein
MIGFSRAIFAGTPIALYVSMSTEVQRITRYPIENDRDNSINCKNSLTTCLQTQKHRYAWLERENSTWHFLTGLFADPAESTRRWPDRQRALDELMSEGWIVIQHYPEKPSKEKFSENCLYGYGLMLIIH